MKKRELRVDNSTFLSCLKELEEFKVLHPLVEKLMIKNFKKYEQIKLI